MVVYIEMDGNVKILSPENLYQGSTTNRVTLITPFPSTTAVGVGFILPDGTMVTDSSGANYFPMELLNTETSAGVTATAYEYALPFTVLEQYGELKLAFKATFTNGNQTSYLAAVEVQESILPTPPENPDEDTYQLLLQYIQTAMQNAANAQSAAEAAQTAAESAEDKAAAAETTANQANETANAANTTAGQANTKADQAVTTSNNAAATAAAANQTAIEAKNQAGAAQNAAAQAQEDADAAAKSASAAENSANEAADSAEEAVTTAQGAVSTANEAKTTADGIDGKASQALTNSEQAVTTANEAKELAEQAVAGAGTEVYVDDALQSRLDFTADPQTQIDNIESGTTKVGSAAQADKLTQARNLKVDLASDTAQSFDGSDNAEDIGVEGVLPVANGGTGASDLNSIKVGDAGSADEATKLATARNMQVNLASGNQQSFDGSEDATEIGVKGILPVGNGGTGATSLANITVGRATADADGNVIEDTYAKSSQVVRIDTSQSLTDTQKQQAQDNINVVSEKGNAQNQSVGWYQVAELRKNGTFEIVISQAYNHVSPEEIHLSVNVGYTSDKNVTITQLSGYINNEYTPTKVRVRANADYVYFDIYSPSKSFNLTKVTIKGYLSTNERVVTTDGFTYIGTSDTAEGYNIVSLDLKTGVNTSGAIYSNGSPVLVGAPPTWIKGTSGSLTLPSAGWYLIEINYTHLAGGFLTNETFFYWDGNKSLWQCVSQNKGSVGFVWVDDNGLLKTTYDSSNTNLSQSIRYYKLA